MERLDTQKQLIAKLAEELGLATGQRLVSSLAGSTTEPNQVDGISDRKSVV